MKWYIIEQYKDDNPETMSRLIFSGKKTFMQIRYVRWTKHFNSFEAAAKHKIKLEKISMFTDFRWWITTIPID